MCGELGLLDELLLLPLVDEEDDEDEEEEDDVEVEDFLRAPSRTFARGCLLSSGGNRPALRSLGSGEGARLESCFSGRGFDRGSFLGDGDGEGLGFSSRRA